jgi:hypothetical protein
MNSSTHFCIESVWLTPALGGYVAYSQAPNWFLLAYTQNSRGLNGEGCITGREALINKILVLVAVGACCSLHTYT